MPKHLLQWLLARSKRMVNSIAFYPAMIAVLFLFASVLLVIFDSSETGKRIKTTWEFLRLQDASTARSIISAIAAGLISLTVFSFSMVMIVLNQAASQMSNRVLDKLIGNRYQQVVLGFYIGTIVYALFLLSTIRDIDEGIYVPSISTYLLILLTVADIFLFIYFLHYITQSVKYEVIIDQIHHQTRKAMEHSCRLKEEQVKAESSEGNVLPAPVSGILASIDRPGLLSLATAKNIQFHLCCSLGSFVLKDLPLLTIAGAREQAVETLAKDILLHIRLAKTTSIDDDFTYGFRQLTEVAVKALSPGINDPGTAVASLRSLADLLAYRLQHFPSPVLKDEKGNVRVTTCEHSFATLFNQVMLPIWDYGKNDRMLREELNTVLQQLQRLQYNKEVADLQTRVATELVLHREEKL